MGYQPSLMKYLEGAPYLAIQDSMHRALKRVGLDNQPWPIGFLKGIVLDSINRPRSVQAQILTMAVKQMQEDEIITKVGRLYQWTDTILEPKMEGVPIDLDSIPLYDPLNEVTE